MHEALTSSARGSFTELVISSYSNFGRTFLPQSHKFFVDHDTSTNWCSQQGQIIFFMTSRQVTISQIHHRKYLNNEPLDEDPCCPACHPVQQTPPPQFIELWNWLSITLCPPLARFNQNTVDAFEAAELLRQQLTRNNTVTVENRTVLAAYQRVFETALY